MVHLYYATNLEDGLKLLDNREIRSPYLENFARASLLNDIRNTQREDVLKKSFLEAARLLYSDFPEQADHLFLDQIRTRALEKVRRIYRGHNHGLLWTFEFSEEEKAGLKSIDSYVLIPERLGLDKLNELAISTISPGAKKVKNLRSHARSFCYKTPFLN